MTDRPYIPLEAVLSSLLRRWSAALDVDVPTGIPGITVATAAHDRWFEWTWGGCEPVARRAGDPAELKLTFSVRAVARSRSDLTAAVALGDAAVAALCADSIPLIDPNTEATVGVIRVQALRGQYRSSTTASLDTPKPLPWEWQFTAVALRP